MAHNNSIQKIKPQKKTGRPKQPKKEASGSIVTLEDAFIHELSDMDNAEKQLIKALPKMAKAASSQQLSHVFESHLKETEQQVELIRKAVTSAKIKLKQEKCDAMEGLIKEGDEVIKEVKAGPVRDVLLIAAAQKVEHYEIASYGCLVAAAKQLGFTEAAEYLDQILDQEKQADRKLNQLAEGGLNEDASTQDTTQKKGTNMPHYRDREYNDNQRGRTPARDEDGRFMSDDDRDYGRNRSYQNERSYQGGDWSERGHSSRSGNDHGRSPYRQTEYDNGRFYAGGRDMPRRDDEGRFISDNDHDAYESQSNMRSDSYYGDDEYEDQRYSRPSNDSYDAYDDNRSRRYASGGQGQTQGQGRGWYGDSEGHARAGRQSHDHQRGRGSSGSGRRY